MPVHWFSFSHGDRPPARGVPGAFRVKQLVRLTSFRRLASLLRADRDWSFVIVAAAIGLLMGTVAMAFIIPLHWLEELFASAPPETLYWLVPLLPAAGGLATGLVMYLMSGGAVSPSVSGVLYAIHRGKSKLPLRDGVQKWIGSTLTLGSGGSAGAEGPIVTIGSVIGSSVARLLKLSPQNTATLLGCGAAAGIASVFNAPIAGIFFVLEVLLRDFSLRTFTPIVIASVISAVWTQTVLGTNEPLFGVGRDFFAREGLQFTVAEVPNYILLGIVCGLSAWLFVKVVFLITNLYSRWNIHPVLKPMTGGLMLGVLGAGYLVFVGPGVPDFYGNGYPVINALLDPSSAYYGGNGNAVDDGQTLSMALLATLVMLAILKAVATGLTIGSGGAGGLFAPSLLLGAATGGAMGIVVNMLGWFPAAPPAYYALVGMAAMLAATTHAPLTGILVVYELTQRYEIILPIMLAAVIATIVSRLISRDSIYTAQLSQLGVRIGTMSDLTLLRQLSVNDVPLTPAVEVHPDESAQRLIDLAEKHAVGDFVVVDERRQYLGMVIGGDLREALVYREAIPLLQVNELQRSNLPTVQPDESLDLVLDKFSRHDVQALPVINESAGTVTGLITRGRLMRLYQRRLAED